MSTPNSSPAPEQAKINQRLVIRTSVLLFGIAALVFGFRWYQNYSKDRTAGAASETAGYIAAVQLKDDGQEAVMIKPDGTVIHSPGWKAEATDRDIVWSPDGNFLFFVSDRKDGVFNVMRWSPSREIVEPRTVGARGRSNPTFPVGEGAAAEKTALVCSGGVVFEFNPTDVTMRQVLPPPNQEIPMSSDDESGSSGATSQFGGLYGQFGQSFKIARWMKGKDWVVGVMKRDEGEILVVQSLIEGKDGKLPRPEALAAGDRIDIDVNPATGALAYAVVGFQWPDVNRVPPEFRKGNRITTPFRHMVGLFDPAGEGGPSVDDLQAAAKGQQRSGPIIASPQNQQAFISPRFSPDGSTLLLVVGPYDGNNVSPKVLIASPAQVGGAASAQPLVQGEVYEPSWSPNGNTVAFVRKSGGKRTVFTVNKDGSSERNVSGDNGDFSTPIFSPQK